ncbi:MAG TPA: PilT/PilU family type 4a pilus ATPase [Polyangiaceae bacterium]|nr:PilT/PilU family type 4a pilus ATPase [Polyangiaceae bacterium]
MFAREASALSLVAGKPPALLVEGRPAPLMDQRPTAVQVRRLVAEITPSEAQAELKGAGQARFHYLAPGDKKVEVSVLDWAGETSVEVTPLSERAPPPPSMELELIPNAVAGPPPRLATGVKGGGSPPLKAAVAHGGPASNGHAVLPVAAPAPRVVTPKPQSFQDSGRPIDRLFHRLVSERASDLHMSSNETPMIRKDGDMVRLSGENPMDAAQLLAMLDPIIPDANRAQFEQENDTDFAYAIEGLARFRANLFRDRHGVGAVFRTIPADIIPAEKLGLSSAITDLCQLHKGLVLVTGPTGSGKSTTLCAMIDLINRTRSGHIITIEDPIEFVHNNKQCLINQREIGPHTRSFKRALRAALREDPDVVLVGEMRDLETISIAIETAETGHLVFGTLHTTTAYSTVDRIIDQYPPDQQEQIRVMLSESLKGVVSQTLCKKIGGGRVAALEVLLVNPAVSNLIREGKTFQIPSIMQTAKNAGMKLMNEALCDLVYSKQVTVEEATAKAVDKTGLAMALKSRGIG